MSSFFGAGEWRAFMLDGAVSQLKSERNPPRRVTSEAEKFLEKEILKRNSRNEPLGILRSGFYFSREDPFCTKSKILAKGGVAWSKHQFAKCANVSERRSKKSASALLKRSAREANR